MVLVVIVGINPMLLAHSFVLLYSRGATARLTAFFFGSKFFKVIANGVVQHLQQPKIFADLMHKNERCSLQ